MCKTTKLARELRSTIEDVREDRHVDYLAALEGIADALDALDNGEGPLLVLAGNPIDGLHVWGPFEGEGDRDEQEVAGEFGERHGADWWIVRAERP